MGAEVGYGDEVGPMEAARLMPGSTGAGFWRKKHPKEKHYFEDEKDDQCFITLPVQKDIFCPLLLPLLFHYERALK